MLKYIFKVLVWRLTPEKKRGELPARPPFDFVKTFTVTLIVLCVVSAVLSYRDNIKIYQGELLLPDFWQMMEDGEVENVSFGLDGGQLVGVDLKNGESKRMFNPGYAEFRRDVMEYGVATQYVSGTFLTALFATLSASVMLIVVSVICIILLRNVMQTHNLNRERASSSEVTFDDVRGMSETKEEVKFAVQQLRYRGALKQMGARPVKGLLFEGPPGTGKTLLARAIAGEAKVPLISASGSDFIEMYVGVGAARIRRLWQQAQDSAPCVVFIDEIDAVGRSRGSNHLNMESNQTINALLQRMDGLGSRTDILVIGATNRKEDLDPALLRPGRFDRVVYVGPPKTQEDRADICELYLSKYNVTEEVTAEKVAKLTAGMTGADIAQCLNDAVLLVAREAHDLVNSGKEEESALVMERPLTLHDIDKAVTRHMLGGVATGHISDRDMKLAAVHEAGHAIVRLSCGVEILKVSITPYTSGAGGLTQTDQEDTMFLSQQELLDRLCFILGGLAAEDVVNGSHSTGVSDDLSKASQFAMQYVVCFGGGSLLNEEALKEMIGFRGISDSKLEAAEAVLQAEAERAKSICVKYRNKLDLLMERLLKETTILNLTPDFLE